MPPHLTTQPRLAQTEGRLVLATAVLQRDKNLRVYRVTCLYNMPQSTLHSRLTGALLQAAANVIKQKLLSIKEQALVY